MSSQSPILMAAGKQTGRLLRRNVFIVASALSLSGCLSLLPQIGTPPTVYKLTQSQTVPADTGLGSIITVNRPIASKALAGDDIVLSPDGTRIAYASDARWVEPVPSLVQKAAMDAIGVKSGLSPISGVNTARSDYILQLNLRDFEAVFDRGEDAAPLAKITMAATLTRTDGRKLVGQTQIAMTHRADSRGVGDIVNAQSVATSKAMAALSDWVADHATIQSF